MSSLKYIAILGRQPELGLMELESVLGAGGVAPFGRTAAFMSEAVHIDRLGGAVKVAEVLHAGTVTDLRQLPLDIKALRPNGGKTTFALSVYGTRDTPKTVLAAGLELKKKLRALGEGTVRLVKAGKGTAVSSAELYHNKVLDEGFELLVIASGKEMVIARTLGVQDIEWYSRRDYDRPARSAKVGMLPPKLAQILVNSTHSEAVYDPFCGTGVVLQEALLLGRSAAGSDLSEEMVVASETNLPWLKDQVEAPLPDWQVKLADARQVKLPIGSAVVSEGYLGPNLSEPPKLAAIPAMRQELRDLYTKSLANFASQLPSGGEVSICVPAWHVGKDWHYLGIIDELPRLGYTLRSFEHVRTPLLYAREDQVVGRQLLLLRKI
jgi:tRNA G10  N-methylase Trm11